MYPTDYSYPQATAVSVNGSTFLSGDISINSGTVTCHDPTSCVLFDGHIPALTGLGGDVWASQLLTLRTTSSTEITFDFLANLGFSIVERVEVVMFNCPQWGIGAQTIQVLEQGTTIVTKPVTITSCSSLVRVCLQARTTIPVLRIRFTLSLDTTWVHLAEVTFYSTRNTCPPAAVVPTTTGPNTESTTTTTTVRTSHGDLATTQTHCWNWV